MTSFLLGRKQRVCIGEDKSEWVNVDSGSILGPLLFILYVNDSLQELNCCEIIFADEVNYQSDQNILQNNLRRLQTWSEKCLLDSNVQNCALINLHPTNYLPTANVRAYYINNTQIPIESSHKDVDVWVKGNLKPSLQCIKAASTSMRVLIAIKRAFVSLDEDIFGKVYGTLIRPHLEYGMQARRK
ncbi:unnamed protein product [Schistocephalus solidus]|uniref:Reverse transcriptase domain-containing protein n=1 Tax=Schistocephalus solidus TaxID=70667 RepID=A0A183TPF5_SCHSO|nr:unnamed protein product [Schistocephalus solidus]